MGMIFAGFAIVLAIFNAVLGRILADDLKTFTPRFCQRVILLAVRKLDVNDASRYEEEWLSHSEEIPETVGKLWHCGSLFFFGAGRIAMQRSSGPRAYRSKRILDVLFVVLALPPIALVVASLAALTRLDGGPAFIKVWKLGPLGTAFPTWKFRTQDPDSGRDTEIGRILKLSSLDELPLLWNVLKGEMSLVGPRALSADSVPDASREYYGQRPGLTGPWQVGANPNRDMANRDYSEKASLRTDLSIMVKTVMVALLGERRNK